MQSTIQTGTLPTRHPLLSHRQDANQVYPRPQMVLTGACSGCQKGLAQSQCSSRAMGGGLRMVSHELQTW